MSSSTKPALDLQVKDKLELTDKEKQIFDRLLRVVDHYNLQTQIRVAGGWVRDKLLGKDSNDIDIALHNMMGEEFCHKVNEYYTLFKGEEKQKIGVVESNPDKSKHLQTARIEMLGVQVDFVNLRSETYSEKNSRIPKVKFGSPKEDADRRDLTINSLFYNIKEKLVEDFTGRGLADLKEGKIVTPLHPMETFLDDPLRVFRAIRFAARFGFVLDEELEEAAASDVVRDAIKNKISRERIGDEINLMMCSNRPVQAMMDICRLQLFWVVFALPEPTISEGCDRLCVAYVDAAWNLLELIGCSTFDDTQKRLYLYSALLLPIRERGTAYYIILESLKRTKSDAEMVGRLHSASERFTSLIPLLADLTVTPSARVLTGLLLRDIEDPHKKKKDIERSSLWRVALMISTLLCPINFDRSEVSSDEYKQIELDMRETLFTTVEKAIVKLGLENVCHIPLAGGKEIMAILQIKEGGSIVGEWKQKLLEWQLADPCRTPEKSLDWMRGCLSKCSEVE
ncbi:CCA tRNA nucleotidyltransferase, mitochondrial-like [Papaver somniferum]|uniref:CCA tRNA nucleotidyltransferase, mitochondrial-like n=1 Tax=Papaver somniferum TaxID=3469 RepID=UPI000E6FCAAC|nr:CCA tRNA nucleotidyltransferase, mitochondrial-like [Papaver somniferum]